MRQALQKSLGTKLPSRESRRVIFQLASHTDSVPVRASRPTWRVAICCLLTMALLAPACDAAEAAARLSDGDIVALIGGENVVSLQRNGTFETLFAITQPRLNARFRYLAWEGDTVFEQYRELNFPSWSEQIERVKPTVIVAQLGQMEALAAPLDRERQPEFMNAFIHEYEALLALIRKPSIRIILVSPTPFERLDPPAPDLVARNPLVKRLTEATRDLAARRGYGFVDLFTPLSRQSRSGRLTRDGVHWNEQGHWAVGRELATALAGRVPGNVKLARSGGELTPPAVEEVRKAVIEKNRLWFDYWRPMNWAFLAGDRTDQPSSRDHRDPKVRWFPDEMQRFAPLIAAEEKRIAERAAKAEAAR